MKLKTLAVLLLAAFAFAPAAIAQNGITLDNVTGLRGPIGDSTFDCGVPVSFFLRFTNTDVGFSVFGLTNGFRFYSPDNLTWTPHVFVDTSIVPFPPPGSTTYDTTIYGAWINPSTPGLVWANATAGQTAIFDGGIFINWFSVDGQGSDTVGFAGFVQTAGVGIYETFSEISLEIRLDELDCHGSATLKHICLDSSFFPPTGFWKWAGSDLGQDYITDWDGPHCFKVYDPNGTGGTGEFDITGLAIDSLYFPDIIPPDSGAWGAPRTFTLTSTGDPITFNIAKKHNATWLTVNPTSGTTPQLITVSVNPASQSGQVADTLVITGSAKAAAIEFPVYFDVTLDVQEVGGNLPTHYALDQNYPNPFNPTTTIAFALPEAARVNLEVYNVLGQKIRTLVDEPLTANNYEIEWDGNNDAGRSVASGVYFYRLRTDSFTQTKKMILSR